MFLGFGAGSQEANHKCENSFFCCFKLCSKLCMRILHSIPFYILAYFNKICFKLFTSDKTNILLLFCMDGSIVFFLLWEIRAVTVTHTAVDREYCKTVVSYQTISAELPESEWLFIIEVRRVVS